MAKKVEAKDWKCKECGSKWSNEYKSCVNCGTKKKK